MNKKHILLDAYNQTSLRLIAEEIGMDPGIPQPAESQLVNLAVDRFVSYWKGRSSTLANKIEEAHAALRSAEQAMPRRGRGRPPRLKKTGAGGAD